MSLREVLAAMPYRLRSRFESLSTYVNACIEQAIEELRRSRAPGASRRVLSDEQRQVIQVTVFIIAVARFFRDGTRAAGMATAEFEELGSPGFAVGRTVFEGRNDNVMMGETLAQELLAVAEDDVIHRWVDSDLALGEIVSRLVQEANDA